MARQPQLNLQKKISLNNIFLKTGFRIQEILHGDTYKEVLIPKYYYPW